MTADSLFAAAVDGIHVLPVLHDRLEAADAVLRAFEVFDPDAVAVEIPSSLERAWLRGVARLPSISALMYETASDETVVLTVHPGDALAEASRSALERGLPIACADLDVDGYGDWRDAVPDSYAIFRLGPGRVHRLFAQSPRLSDRLDAAREASMAFHARRLRAAGASRLLLVCGMHHATGVARALEVEQAVPLTPPVRKNVRLVHLHPESLGEVMAEPPFYLAAYESRRRGLPPVSAEAPAPAGRSYGPYRVLSAGLGDSPGRIEASIARAARHAARGPWPWDRRPRGDAAGPVDRLKLQWALLREAEDALLAAAPDEKVERWQLRHLARFSRNLASLSGGLLADLHDLLAAARGTVSDNFAWELHRLATAYPLQAERASDLPTARLRAEEIFRGIRRIRLIRRLRRPKSRGLENLLRRRRRDERWPGEWLQAFDENSICSFPPEDLRVEEFGRYLKRKGISVLSEERSRAVPFTTSILDGIDLRETIRHRGEGRIWVRENGRSPGGVGSVVVIFDEDAAGEERFPYRLSWLGEHEQESDMAFYATAPEQAIVGPGICRATYGGFLLSYPPGRLGDIWSDPDYRMAETKGEVLLLAALDYSVERIVVHAAPRPPRAILQQLAARIDRKILHVPLGTLSPGTIRRIRVMHILSGRERRADAKEYIW